MSSLNFIYRLMCYIIAISQLCASCQGIIVHIQDNLKHDTVIVDLNRQLNSVQADYQLLPLGNNHAENNLFTIHAKTGKMITRKDIRCSDLKSNPLSYLIRLRPTGLSSQKLTHLNKRLIPITIYTHGSRCRLQDARKKIINTNFATLNHQGEAYLFLAEIFPDVALKRIVGQVEPVERSAQRHIVLTPISKRIVKIYCKALTDPSKTASLCSRPFHLQVVTRYQRSLNVNFAKIHLMTDYQINTNHDRQNQKVINHHQRHQLVEWYNRLPSKNNPILEHHRNRRSIRSKRDVIAPVFTQSSYSSSIFENEPSGTTVLTVSVRDKSAPGLTYSMAAVGDLRSNSLFGINSVSGAIYTVNYLDREEIAKHQFTVTATVNDGTTTLFSRVSVTIDVLDRNDNAPRFESPSYQVSIPEDIPIGTTALQVRAQDNDASSNARVTYSIVNSAGINSAFRVGVTSGAIIIDRSLDREITDRYHLEIQATDSGTTPKFARSNVTIIVTDVNDNPPQFTQKNYKVTIAEDAKINTLVTTVRATDPDNDDNADIRYSLAGQNKFTINPTNGRITLIASLDYEQQQSYTLDVTAKDRGRPSLSNTTTVVVSVTDVNDNQPRFSSNVYQASVKEDIPVGSSVLPVHAFDADSDQNKQVRYSIQRGSEEIPFNVDSVSGVISTARPLNYESKSQYSFFIIATDGGTPPLSSSAQVTVTVVDVNDNAPKFPKSIYNADVREDEKVGRQIVQVTATDVDSKTIYYSIVSGNVRSRFGIDPQGYIYLAAPIDYLREKEYTLVVQASDLLLNSTATVKMRVIDTNNHAPTFDRAYTADIYEDTAIGTVILTVTAKDADANENARLTYRIVTPVREFKIDSKSGAISIAAALDRETRSTFSLEVRASDNGVPSLSGRTDVVISILDSNDNAPVFSQPSYNASIAEDVEIGTRVLQVAATDKDEGVNQQIHFELAENENGNGTFAIDGSTGVIRTAKALDRETVPEYTIVVTAIDKGRPPKHSFATVKITITDVKDSPPEFYPKEYDAYLPENSPAGTTVVQLNATSKDEGTNAFITYEATSGFEPRIFHVNSSNGVVTTLRPLDFEIRRTYQIRVRAQSPPFFTETTVTIHIIDVNDNPPTIQNYTFLLNYFPDYYPTASVGKLNATDPDISDTLTFAIIQGNNDRLLQLNRTSGEIYLSPSAGNVQESRQMTISVSDGIHVARSTLSLKVIAVTSDTLKNIAVLRFTNILPETFITNMTSLLTNTIAGIMRCQSRDIYILNVQQDDVAGQNILNVTISGWDRTNNRYYLQNYFRDSIYIYREQLLAKGFNLLPFDGGYCLPQPCSPNYDCVVNFGASLDNAVVSTPKIIVRNIRQAKRYACECPVGYTGLRCNRMRNLCRSNPCGNNGKCVNIENGYTCICNSGYAGINCEIGSCASQPCKNGASCVENANGQGFYCTCPKYYGGPLCDAIERSFPGNSYVTVGGIKQRWRLEISVQFATIHDNGLLLYNGRYNHRGDYLALELINGKVRLSFSTGTDKYSATANIEGNVNDGKWHTVSVKYLNQVASVSIDYCDTDLAIRYGSTIGNYSCAATTLSQDQGKSLDVTAPLQIGGVPTIRDTYPMAFKKNDFVGCIRNLYINSKLIPLDNFYVNNGSVIGCRQTDQRCQGGSISPCSSGAECVDVYDGFRCRCPANIGGKTCQDTIVRTWRFTDQSIIIYPLPPLQNTITAPWSLSLIFRTRLRNAYLSYMTDSQRDIVLMIENGLLKYKFGNYETVVKYIRVNDGEWHEARIEWEKSGVFLKLDYNSYQASFQLDLSRPVQINQIMFGGNRVINSSTSIATIQNGFDGCMQGIAINDRQIAVTSFTVQQNVGANCNIGNPCASNPCPSQSSCVAEWNRYTCKCSTGYVGPKCISACSLNPCKNNGRCVMNVNVHYGYECQCNKGFQGRFCETQFGDKCQPGEFGTPGFCEPCACDRNKNFSHICNITSGECICEDKYWKDSNLDSCRPCDCYQYGSTSPICDKKTGSCTCRPGVTGDKCNLCVNKTSEISTDGGYGCRVVRGACPRSFSGGLWWNRSRFNATITMDCPNGASGKASRVCNESTSWQDPDTSACTSRVYLRLQSQFDGYKQNPTFTGLQAVLNDLNQQLKTSGLSFEHDINICLDVVNNALSYGRQLLGRSNQRANTNEVNTITEKSFNAISELLSRNNLDKWSKKSNRSSTLLSSVNDYTNDLGKAYIKDKSINNAITYPNVMMRIEEIIVSQYNGLTLPRPSDSGSVSNITDRISLPNDLVKKGSSDESVPIVYLKFDTIGQLLPGKSDVVAPYDIMVTSTVLSCKVVGVDTSSLSSPITLTLSNTKKVSNVQAHECVYWKKDLKLTEGGRWSTDGCSLISRDSSKTVCQCNHLTDFGVLSRYRSKPLPSVTPIKLELVTYIGIGISLLLLVSVFLCLTVMRSVNGSTNTIHCHILINLILVESLFLIGITQTASTMICIAISTLLHFFLLVVFSWICIESIYMYRKLKETKKTTKCHLLFCLLPGYGIPAAIATATTAISLSYYHNKRYCWLSVEHGLIWSLGCPAACIIGISLVFFCLTYHKIRFRSNSMTRWNRKEIDSDKFDLRSGMLILLFITAAWVFGVIAVQNETVYFQYIFTMVNFIKSACILICYCISNESVRSELSARLCGREGTYYTGTIDKGQLNGHRSNGLNGHFNGRIDTSRGHGFAGPNAYPVARSYDHVDGSNVLGVPDNEAWREFTDAYEKSAIAADGDSVGSSSEEEDVREVLEQNYASTSSDDEKGNWKAPSRQASVPPNQDGSRSATPSGSQVDKSQESVSVHSSKESLHSHEPQVLLRQNQLIPARSSSHVYSTIDETMLEPTSPVSPVSPKNKVIAKGSEKVVVRNNVPTSFSFQEDRINPPNCRSNPPANKRPGSSFSGMQPPLAIEEDEDDDMEVTSFPNKSYDKQQHAQPPRSIYAKSSVAHQNEASMMPGGPRHLVPKPPMRKGHPQPPPRSNPVKPMRQQASLSTFDAESAVSSQGRPSQRSRHGNGPVAVQHSVSDAAISFHNNLSSSGELRNSKQNDLHRSSHSLTSSNGSDAIAIAVRRGSSSTK
ncbi:uncharacterized protein TRIADDRAFT_62266 [Trichoplax adhaerens]|uniref:Protocadherin-like wing polarity protein stan n=1 Tax=Trichoplax adhaerens TaxID=10228 RepID=B3SDA8_TRIAD|nr:hypothetical protein TRIADDRAFT_62266 [Trichoplax adhaerens]EDV19285.1 hypothetical protein TRIADDRAFT_62266 [Trichoplax adhaerens]|eukprot:XP_002118209.1 hypothetical protein TRIADDRAFT_62266 [Trichoplax adhaerens]